MKEKSSITKQSLRDWQQVAYDLWELNKYKGTVEACTGAGKTIFAIHCIKKTTTEGKVLITVPTIVLLKQWEKELKEHFDEQIGVYYSKEKKVERITIGVDKSLQGKRIKGCSLLICDEVHKMQSKNNADFLLMNNFQNILGISATAERDDLDHNNYVLKLAPIVYRYTIEQAIKDKILTPYEEINIPVPFEEMEANRYNIVDSRIKQLFRLFNFDYSVVMSKKMMWNKNVIELKRLINERKQLIYLAKNKVKKAVELIANLPKSSKSIIFDERIEVITKINQILNEEFGIPSAIYHSGLKSELKSHLFSLFKKGEIRIMLSVKSLEEGVNIPDCDTAIFINGSSVKRQKIQRLGRVLRLSPDKNMASIYKLYIPNTKDSDWLFK